MSLSKNISADALMQLFAVIFGQQASNYNSSSTIPPCQPRAGDIKVQKEFANSESKENELKGALAKILLHAGLGQIAGYFSGAEYAGFSSVASSQDTGNENPVLTKDGLETQNFLIEKNDKSVVFEPQKADQVITSAGVITISDTNFLESISPEVDPQISRSPSGSDRTVVAKNPGTWVDTGNRAIRFSLLDLRSRSVLVDLQVLEKAGKIQTENPATQGTPPVQISNLQGDPARSKNLDSTREFYIKPGEVVTNILSMLMKDKEGSTGNKENKDASPQLPDSSFKNPDVSAQSSGESARYIYKPPAGLDIQGGGTVRGQNNRGSKEQINPNLLMITSRPDEGFLKADSLMGRESGVNVSVFRDRLYEIAQNILREAKLMIQDGKSEVSMKLEPESLGSVVLKVASQDGKVSAEFNVRTQDARAYIESALPQMREILTGSGIPMQNMSVNLLGNSITGRNHQNFARWKSRQHYDYKMSTDIEESVRNFGYNTMEMKI
ncbi:MAG: flagellar hook-length control protein FliK [Candidatus Kryptoniota bacterium]